MNFELENKKNKPPLYNIDLTNNIHEQTPTEASKGGTLLHISEELNYKTCKDLHVYKAKELESTFLEIINKKRKNLIVDCIYNNLNFRSLDAISHRLYKLFYREKYQLKKETTT